MYAFNTQSYKDSQGNWKDAPRNQEIEPMDFKFDRLGHVWHLASDNKLSVTDCTRDTCSICIKYAR